MKRQCPPRTIEEMDREANYFAMCLLVPTGLLKEEISKLGGHIELSDDDQLKALARKFGVSMMVMAIRLMDVTDDR